MEEVVEELRRLIEFKDMLESGDVAVIAGEDPQMLAFAVVTDIQRDRSRKDEWWHVSMQMLSVPLQAMTWTLRTEQMSGQEIFTMGGKKMFMAPVYIHKEPAGRDPEEKVVEKGKDVPAGKRKKATILRIVK